MNSYPPMIKIFNIGVSLKFLLLSLLIPYLEHKLAVVLAFFIRIYSTVQNKCHYLNSPNIFFV